MRSTELEGPPVSASKPIESDLSSLQLGLGLAPTAGLQWPWALNRFDTRVVLFAEVAPEWTVWGDPHVSGSLAGGGGTEDPGLGRALSDDDTQITTTLGLRFEL